jgi:myo-inositol-1(or 4)-monophosphatase
VERRTSARLRPRELDELERCAFELATLAGNQLIAAVTGSLSFRYKTPATDTSLARDPVSDVDVRIEELVRAHVAKRYPEHAVLGEETSDRPVSETTALVWAVDPIDGTMNFLHRFPLFASSIAVLHDGDPVAGAIWCSCSHEVRPGVYHARTGGELHFEGRALEPRTADAQFVESLIGEPHGLARQDAAAPAPPGDLRMTGSAALECAFVAAEILDAAIFRPLWVWDVAAGIALVRAAGAEVWTRSGERWARFERFSEGHPMATREWHQPLVIGRGKAAEALRASH